MSPMLLICTVLKRVAIGSKVTFSTNTNVQTYKKIIRYITFKILEFISGYKLLHF